MMLEIVMPQKNPNMHEGQIVEWEIEEGEIVKKGDILFTFKVGEVIYELEAPENGMLGRVVSFENEKVPVGGLVAYLDPGVID